MGRPGIRSTGLRSHYTVWVVDHPTAIPFEQFDHYLEHGDEFGDPVPIRVLAELTKSSKNTVVKWLAIYDEEYPGKRKK